MKNNKVALQILTNCAIILSRIQGKNTVGGHISFTASCNWNKRKERYAFFIYCDKHEEEEVMLLTNKQDAEDLILIINRQLDIEYCNNSGISNNSEFLREINLFTYIKQFETGIFRNGRYEILIDDAMLAWGLYYIVRIKGRV